MAAVLAFFTTGVGRYIAAAFLGFVVCAGIYSAGYRASSKASQADRLRIERDAALRDLKISNEAASYAERLLSEANRRSADAMKKAEDYAKSLPENGRCALTGDDLKRLRDIRKR